MTVGRNMHPLALECMSLLEEHTESQRVKGPVRAEPECRTLVLGPGLFALP